VIEQFRMRCSALSSIMTTPKSIDPALLSDQMAAIAAKKSKTLDDHMMLAPLYDLTLSEGAKTYLDDLAKEFLYSYHDVVSSKYTDKGNIVEADSIELYNERFGTFYSKNGERRENDYISGECDIYTGRKIIDVKSSWSVKTFPVVAEDAHKPEYEWQVRGYMWLWDVEEAEVAYCLVDTPDELIGYENIELHEFSRLPLELRVTSVRYQRDRALEEKIARKVTAARAYLAARIERVRLEHPIITLH
jgi:hypothetical protein